jgi:hypothetical protein
VRAIVLAMARAGSFRREIAEKSEFVIRSLAPH